MNTVERWPIPVCSGQRQPHFLIVIAPPYSGSTALAKILETSPRVMLLNERGEGQWLIPGLSEKDRWNPMKVVNYQSVRAVWLRRYEDETVNCPDVDVVVEKSPPNMMRLERIGALFEQKSYLAINRDPFANCSSFLYRNYSLDQLGVKERKALLEMAANAWRIRSEVIRDLVERLAIPLVTYENFCADPTSLSKLLQLPSGIADTIDFGARIRVKDYPDQRIKNQNAQQIARLATIDRDTISRILVKNRSLLDYFGYRNDLQAEGNKG